MKKYLTIMVMMMIGLGLIGQASFAFADNEVVIEDEALRYGLKSILNKPVNEPLTKEDLLSLTVVDLRGLGIKSLSGLEHATNLTHLRLSGNEISDLSPLKAITTLRELDVRNNYITSIDDLAGLTDMGRLYISNNGVSSIEEVRNFPRLHTFYVSGNPVSSLDALEETKELSWLEATDNGITDISVLSELPKLRYVQLDNNRVEDLTSLQHLSTTLTGISFNNNLISDLSPLASLTKLKSIKLANNQITDLRPLEHLSELEELQLSGNRIWDISPISEHEFYSFPASATGDARAYYSLGLADNYLDLSKGSETLKVFESLSANNSERYTQGKFQRLVIGSDTAYSGDRAVSLETAPYISSDRTYVPIRFVANELDAEVTWDQDREELILQKGDKTIRWVVGNKQAWVDGSIVMFDVPLMQRNGSVFVPIRFVSDQLGAAAAFINDTKTTLIFNKQ
ncbi:leucine-rich repeat domain-containing protein [Neobacillus mesonae]|nr:leucine-rich repeat domain-containing protein [Neobacillus mesonae]